jgi:hypothetical protein
VNYCGVKPKIIELPVCGRNPMKALCTLTLFVALVGVFLTALVVANQEGQVVQEPVKVPDVAKRAIEVPLEIAIGGETKAAIETSALESSDAIPGLRRDMGKSFIEGPIETLVALNAEPTSDPDANPLVEPGKVVWHADFATACAASAESGKPVLLFQLLGQLDHRFT